MHRWPDTNRGKAAHLLMPGLIERPSPQTERCSSNASPQVFTEDRLN